MTVNTLQLTAHNLLDRALTEHKEKLLICSKEIPILSLLETSKECCYVHSSTSTMDQCLFYRFQGRPLLEQYLLLFL